METQSQQISALFEELLGRIGERVKVESSNPANEDATNLLGGTLQRVGVRFDGSERYGAVEISMLISGQETSYFPSATGPRIFVLNSPDNPWAFGEEPIFAGLNRPAEVEDDGAKESDVPFEEELQG